MSVLGFDIRDYTDPQRMLEESIRAPFGTVVSPQPPMTPPPSATPPPQQAPVPQQQPPATIDQGTGLVVSGPAGINPAATEQPPGVPIPGTAGPSGVTVGGGARPASIKPMEGVTNYDRLHAMAMVLGSVGQNNFSNVMGAAQAGLMEKELTAREYNDQLRQLTTPQYAIKDGRLSYVPAQFEVDKDGNYVPRSEKDIEADIQQHLKDNPSLDHQGGATGYREDKYIDRYYAQSESAQIQQAEQQGVYGRPLNEVELIDRHMKNSIGLAAGMEGAKASTGAQAQRLNDNFLNWYDVAENAETNLDKLDATIKDLKENSDRGGIFQPLEQIGNEILAEFGNEEAVKDATREQILKSQSIKRMMNWFRSQGLGARGLDTPAEFKAWLDATGGNLSLTNQATIDFLKEAREDILKGVDKYNEAFEQPNYQANVVGMENYSPLPGLRDRYAKESATPDLPPGFIIQGQ